ncbi:MAG: hypothetical protein CL726_05345 [Chloroflexi bacterium]|jgi:hypothetical protein|nr:hypothetical protein [Chloroflexota bacterium]
MTFFANQIHGNRTSLRALTILGFASRPINRYICSNIRPINSSHKETIADPTFTPPWGSHDPPSKWILTEEGRERSKRLGEYFRERHTTRIITSSEVKVIETAKIAARVAGISEVVVDMVFTSMIVTTAQNPTPLNAMPS